MLSKDESTKALRRLFQGRQVADLDELCEVLDTRSRMSVFRRLRDLGYLSSYSHRGRYYTLAHIPDFDQDGLWRYHAIGFSRFGTIKETIARRVEEAEAGATHSELEALLRLKVYDALLELVQAGRLCRERVGATYLYLSSEPDRGARQLALRRQQLARDAQSPARPAQEAVLLVLVEALHASEGLPAAAVVARRLVARGEVVTTEQVARVYAHFGLQPGKKTAAPP